MTKPMKEEMLKELAFSWGHGGIGSKHDMYLAIRSLIEKFGDGGPNKPIQLRDKSGEILSGGMLRLALMNYAAGRVSLEKIINWIKEFGVVVEEEKP